MKLSVVLLLLIGVSCGALKPTQATVSALESRPAEFAGRIVVVEGVLAMGPESTILRSSENMGRDAIWLDYAKLSRSAPGFGKLERAFAEAELPDPRRYSMTPVLLIRAIGRFSHTDDKLRGFGHLGHYQSQFTIEEILDAKPWTKRPNQAPEPTTTLVTPRAGARLAPSSAAAHL